MSGWDEMDYGSTMQFDLGRMKIQNCIKSNSGQLLSIVPLWSNLEEILSLQQHQNWRNCNMEAIEQQWSLTGVVVELLGSVTIGLVQL